MSLITSITGSVSEATIAHCILIASNKNKANLQQELLDTFIPDVANNASGIEKVNIGDAYKVDGEDGIRIKISDTESKKINISKETYYKLLISLIYK